VNRCLRIASITVIVVVVVSPSLTAAESEKKSFVAAWQDRNVVLKRTLFSIVFDERSKWLPMFKHEGRVTGLTVGTPGSTYYQFDARREAEEDIVAADPNVIVSTLRDQYRRSAYLEIGHVQDVQPLTLVRYEPGVELVVKKVQIERDRVRLLLHKDRKGDLSTSITVKWPVPLSKDLSESTIIDDILDRYVARR
jgi:hypothetical protein